MKWKAASWRWEKSRSSDTNYTRYVLLWIKFHKKTIKIAIFHFADYIQRLYRQTHLSIQLIGCLPNAQKLSKTYIKRMRRIRQWRFPSSTFGCSTTLARIQNSQKIYNIQSRLKPTDETVVFSWFCCGDKAIIKRSRIRYGEIPRIFGRCLVPIPPIRSSNFFRTVETEKWTRKVGGKKIDRENGKS